MPKKKGSDKLSIDQVVRALLEGAATSFVPTDEAVRAAVKTIRDYLSGPAAAEHIYKILSKFIVKTKRVIYRERAVDLIDYIFTRSNIFRGVLITHLSELIRSCCGGCENTARDIQRSPLALSLLAHISSWDGSFGDHYPELRALIRYYRETLHVISGSTATDRASEALARQERLRKLLYVSCMKILESSKEYLQTLETSLSSAEAIFSLLFPAVTLKRSYSDMMADCIPCSSGAGASDGAGYLTSDSIEWEDGDIEGDLTLDESESYINTINSAGLMTSNYSLEIVVGVTIDDVKSTDNEILIEQLREISCALKKHNLPRLSEWERLLVHTLEEIRKHPMNSQLETLLLHQLPSRIKELQRVKIWIEGVLNDKIDKFLTSGKTVEKE